jgi:membrane-associated protease RseP (regulator of RpoE activity)
MKEVILNKNGQISLVCFLCILLTQPILISLLKFGVVPMSGYIVVYIIILPILTLSIVLGLKQLRKTKFPLLWIIPGFLYSLSIIVALCFSFFHKDKVIHPPKRKIGVYLNKTTEGKMQVKAVVYNSKAEKAGIKGGDIITKINNEDIDDEDYIDVISLMGKSKDSELKIVIERNGEKKIFNIDKTANKKNASNSDSTAVKPE